MFSAVVNKPNTLAATLAADAHEQLANTGQVRNANAIAPVLSPPAIALIDRAIGYVRPHLDRSISVSNRIRNLWAAVVAARDLGASDVIEDEFMRLAGETGLARDLGRHADETLRHVIRWAMLGRNPF
jgi:hypothetical protein